jgi:hypothetical protein
MFDSSQTQPNYNDLFMAQNLGLTPPMSGVQSPYPAMLNAPPQAMPQAQPIAGPQNVQMPPEVNHIMDVIGQYAQNKQTQQNNGGLVQDILSNRMQPGLQDASQATSQTAQSFLAPNLFKPQTADQAMAERYTNQLSPYTEGLGLANTNAGLSAQLMKNNIQQQTGLPNAMSEIALRNAQAGYYSTALQRDLAEKQFEYQNDPARLQAAMMATYMQRLSGIPAPNTQPSGMLPTDAISMPGNQPLQSSMTTAQPSANTQPLSLPQAMPKAGGFNPMGAMLAKTLGLTDMQIGPDGQPMPIPGAMKIENGSVITIGPDGKPQSNIPVNPRAQGLFEQKLQDINEKIDKLHVIGGTVEEGGSFIHNKLTQAAASQDSSLFGMIPSGQSFLQGTQAQSLRDDIQADVKQALPLYMQAFGITPGMERAASAQQMLQDAIGGAVGKSRQHLKSNLINLSNTAGTGELAKSISPIKVISPSGVSGTIDHAELSTAIANGWKVGQ